jgi:hypothetical protein
VCIIAGTASLIPAIITGWTTWKRYYHGSTGRLFRRKIITGFVMLGISLPLAVWRVLLYSLGSDALDVEHYAFFLLTTVLIGGAVIEGYLGGRLSHH